MSRIPKVTHIVYAETPHGENTKELDLSGFPESVKIIPMSKVEEEGAKPENRKLFFSSLCLWVIFVSSSHFIHFNSDHICRIYPT